jgi:histidinol-phosphate/aromatic aminotransferase/cobyric acid decarboxylase-like protein
MTNQARVISLGRENRRIREAFADALGDIGLQVIPSHTNFLLVKFASVEIAAFVEQCLRSKGILVRPMHAYQLPDYLRITIGTESQMQRVTEGVAGCLKDV